MANYNTSTGNHTFNDEIRVDDIKNNAGSGLPTLNGTSPEVKYQKKTLSTTVSTTDTDVTELKFNGLTIGKTYRWTGVFCGTLANPTGTLERIFASLIHNGATLAEGFFRHDDESINDVKQGTISLQVIFVAAATTASTSITIGATNGTVVAESNGVGTYTILEELPYHTETTNFT